MTRRTAIGMFFAGMLTPILSKLGRDKAVKTAVCAAPAPEPDYRNDPRSWIKFADGRRVFASTLQMHPGELLEGAHLHNCTVRVAASATRQSAVRGCLFTSDGKWNGSGYMEYGEVA